MAAESAALLRSIWSALGCSARLLWGILSLSLLACEAPPAEEAPRRLLDFAPIPDATLRRGDRQSPSSPADGTLIQDHSLTDRAEDRGDRSLTVDQRADEEQGRPEEMGRLPDRGAPPAAMSDADGDGLRDRWEWLVNDEATLSWQSADSDGDGITDGEEDPDEDGLSNQVEELLWRLSGAPETLEELPNPLVRDLLLELDMMEGRVPPEGALAAAQEAFAALSAPVRLHYFWDERALPAQRFSGSFEERHAFLRGHPPQNLPEGFPIEQLLHVAFVEAREDAPQRGGEVVTHPEEREASGLLIYLASLESLHPRCGLMGPEPVLALSFEEGVANTLTHELGHMLQLGHDDASEGGVNSWNIMSLPMSCVEEHQRARGVGNLERDLGSTEEISGPRFSAIAESLFRFDLRLSIDTGELINDGQGRSH